MLDPRDNACFVKTVRPGASKWQRAAASFVALQVLVGVGAGAAHADASFYTGTNSSGQVFSVTAPFPAAPAEAPAPVYASGDPLGGSYGIARATDNTLYVTDRSGNEIIKISPDGSTKTVLSPPAGTTNLLMSPADLVLASGGASTLYVTSSSNNRIIAVDTTSGAQTLISSNGGTSSAATGSLAQNSFLNNSRGLIQGPDGKLYAANVGNNNVVRIDIATGVQEVYATIGGGASQLWGVAFDPSGALYVSTVRTNRVVRVAPPATTGGVGGAQTDVPSGGLLLAAEGMAYSQSDNSLYVANFDNRRIVQLPLDGTTAPRTVSTLSADGPVEVEMLAPFTFAPPTTPPSVQSVLRNGNNPTSATSVTFTVTFSEAVTGVDSTDFAPIFAGGTSGGTVSAVSGEGATYSVTISGITGTGTVGLEVLDDDTIKDNEQTPLSAGNTSGERFTIESSAPLASGTSGEILISEVRFSGPGGTQDDFIELYNTTGTSLDISGFRVINLGNFQARTLLVLPANSIIPARGHFLIAGSGYSLGTTATPDSVLGADVDIQEDTPVVTNRAGGEVDRVTLSTSGTGLSAGAQHAFVRRFNATTSSEAIDTGAASDFTLVATSVANGNLATVQGAPGPESTQSPVQRNATLVVTNFNPSVSSSASPNRERYSTPAGAPGSPTAFGTYLARFKVTNNTGQRVTQLSLRAVRLTTKNSPGYTPEGRQGDLRILSSTTATVNGQTVYGTTLQAPAQEEGGGLNSSATLPLAAGTMTLSDALEPGETQNFSFLFGVAKTGSINFTLNLEATPAP